MVFHLNVARCHRGLSGVHLARQNSWYRPNLCWDYTPKTPNEYSIVFSPMLCQIGSEEVNSDVWCQVIVRTELIVAYHKRTIS